MTQFVAATALSALLVCQGCASAQDSAAPSRAAPPKVVLIIGDGMDDQQITIARNYLAGDAGRLMLDTMRRSRTRF